MNNINICGRLTADPELKTSQSGHPVCAYNLAVKRPKVKDTTDFITCVSWRQGAEYITKYAHKGDMVAVSGVLTTRSWEDKNGNKRVSYEVVADTVEIVGGKKQEQNTQPATIEQLPQYPAPSAQFQQAFANNQQGFETIVADEDLPF